MKKTMMKISRFLLCFTFGMIAVLVTALSVRATNLEELPSLTIESYSLSNEKIIPGQEFTLSLKIKNNSSSILERNVIVNISNPVGVVPAYGTISQTTIAKLAPGECAEVSFDYTASESLTLEHIDFGVTVTGFKMTNVALRAPIGADNPFSILSVNLPEAVFAGDVISAGASFKVIGDENVLDVSVELLLNDDSVSSSSIGILKPGTTRNQSISTIISKTGTYTAQIVLNYEDETGQVKKVVVKEGEIYAMDKVLDAEKLPGMTVEQPQTTPNKQDSRILLGIGGLAVLAVLAGANILVRRKR